MTACDRVCIRNVNRKTYVHLEKDGTLNTSELIPWGDDATVTLEGKYGLRASNGKFLANSGALKDTADADARFIIEFFSSQIAFKGNNGRALHCPVLILGLTAVQCT